MAKNKSTTLTSRSSHGYVISIDRAADPESDAENPSTNASEPLVRHQEFYFDNTLIAIQIENTLFNVHKYQLAKSKVFSDMFENMGDDEGGKTGERSSPDLPVVMKGISASDFAALLKIIYANHCPGHQPTTEAPLIIPAFRLANALEFSELRANLLPLAEKELGDVEKIVFAREFDIKEWLAPAHIRLCQREEPLSTEEARKLEVDSVLIISHMREKHRSQGHELVTGGDYCGACLGIGYHGANCSCRNCSSSTGWFRSSGPGKMWNRANVDNAAIEAGVTKWVDDGYVVIA